MTDTPETPSSARSARRSARWRRLLGRAVALTASVALALGMAADGVTVDAPSASLPEARAADRGCPRSGNCDLPGRGRPKRPGSVDGGGPSAPTTRPGPIDGARPL